MNNNDYNKITDKIISCAIEVHKNLGPGLLEKIYENALCIELSNNNIKFETQKDISVHYKGHALGTYKMDLIIENCIVVELKSVERHDPLFDAQILSYMKLGNYPLGLLINFNSKMLVDGIKRKILNIQKV